MCMCLSDEIALWKTWTVHHNAYRDTASIHTCRQMECSSCNSELALQPSGNDCPVSFLAPIRQTQQYRNTQKSVSHTHTNTQTETELLEDGINHVCSSPSLWNNHFPHILVEYSPVWFYCQFPLVDILLTIKYIQYAAKYTLALFWCKGSPQKWGGYKDRGIQSYLK